MYPEGTVKSYGMARAYQAVKGLVWGSSDSSKGMDIPAHDQVQQQCLFLHLRHEKQLLLKCLVEDIHSHALSILHIFYQMLYPMIQYDNRNQSRPADNVSKVWNIKVLTQRIELIYVYISCPLLYKPAISPKMLNYFFVYFYYNNGLFLPNFLQSDRVIL